MSRIAIVGAGGKMGRCLTQACVDAAVEVVAAVEPSGSPWLGQDAGTLAGGEALGVALGDDLDEAAQRATVMIEFSRPAGTLAALAACRASGCALVSGTTGLDAAQRAQLREVAEQIPVLTAANFSVGVNVCLRLLAEAARALGEDFDVEIVEAHHRHKVDAPSGTALAMGEAVAGALGRDLSRCAVYGREGHTGARERQSIGFETIRGGDVVGEHTVMFLGAGERVEISHRASSRMNFAAGAVRAARWLAGRPPGLYSMRDVLAEPG